MILFVFEGQKREPDLYQTIQTLYFSNSNQQIICSFGNNLYELYRELQKYEGDGDLVALLKEKFKSKKNNPFANVQRSSDFSEIYLFFDYDFHNRNLPLEELNRELDEMLKLFSDESNNGKLYINYPMVESIRYTKKLPDSDYYSYVVSRKDCNNFKHLVANFSAYNNLDYIQIDKRKKTSTQRLDQLRQNWEHLKNQNINKANYLCSGNNCIPDSKDDIAQIKIFNSQLTKYVLTESCHVSILNAFPLFLYDYFPINKQG